MQRSFGFFFFVERADLSLVFIFARNVQSHVFRGQEGATRMENPQHRSQMVVGQEGANWNENPPEKF